MSEKNISARGRWHTPSIEFADFSHSNIVTVTDQIARDVLTFFGVYCVRVRALCKDEKFWLAPGKCSGNRGAGRRRGTKLLWLLQSS